jgi:hypothetical protein
MPWQSPEADRPCPPSLLRHVLSKVEGSRGARGFIKGFARGREQCLARAECSAKRSARLRPRAGRRGQDNGQPEMRQA